MFWAAAEQTAKEKRRATRPHFRGGESISHHKGEDLQSGRRRVSAICDTHLCIRHQRMIKEQFLSQQTFFFNSWNPHRCFMQIPLSLESTSCHQCIHTYYLIVVALLLAAGGSISSLFPHLGFNLYKYSCNFAWFVVIPRWEYNPVWNVQLPAQGADVRLRVSGRRSLSSTLHHWPEERWGMSRRTEGTAEQTECVNSEGHSRFSGKLRAVWAACQKVSRRQK